MDHQQQDQQQEPYESSPRTPVQRRRTFSSSAQSPESITSLVATQDLSMDGLLSLGSAANASFGSTTTPLSPTSHERHTSSDYYFPDWRLTNPVHMELQENAKVPTFNWSVDRTGSAVAATTTTSSTTSTSAPQVPSITSATSAAAAQHPLQQPILGNHHQHKATPSLDDSSINWAELFLRASKSANYHRAGVLRQDTTKQINPDAAPFVVDISNVDPTPLSEIKRRVQQRQEQQQQQGGVEQDPMAWQPTPVAVESNMDVTNNKSNSNDNTPPTAEQTSTEQPQPSSLPAIPTPMVNISDAVATAAALAASTQQQPQTQPQRTTTTTTTTTTGRHSSMSSTVPVASTAGRPRPSYTVPNATKHSSGRHRQYGFGTKHVVPAVPQPPSSHKHTSAKESKSKANHHSSSNNKATVVSNSAPGNGSATTTARIKHPKSVSPVPSSSTAKTANRPATTTTSSKVNANAVKSTQAYERKKQRAKDARVKLNDAIDRLSISIGLAGTQSQQRLQLFQQKIMPLNNNNTNSAACAQIMQDCVRTAESARKWDRPSFVGTAATLIETLNAQCDVLMQQVQALQQQQQPTRGVGSNGNNNGNGNNHSHEKRTMEQDEQQYQQQQESNQDELPHKRLRTCRSANGENWNKTNTAVPHTISIPTALTSTTTTTGAPPTTMAVAVPSYDGSIFTQKIMSLKILTFLDPRSLVRCRLVSKAWRCFATDNELWEGLAVARFGFYSVRQWRERFSDEEPQQQHREMVGSDSSTTSQATGVNAIYYKRMDIANIMPHFAQKSNMVLLGKARLPGAVSAWTFLVKRSNGETLRSVKRQPDMTGSGIFISLPVIELRTVVQNTGVASVVLRKQTQVVDSSTRRKGGEMREIDWDERFQKRVANLDGTPRNSPADDILCRLNLFDAAMIETYIYAKGCSTASKFLLRSNYTQLLVQIRNGTTSPLVIPFSEEVSGQ